MTATKSDELTTIAKRGGLTGWLQTARLSNFYPRENYPEAEAAWEDCVLFATGVLPWAQSSSGISETRNWLILSGNYGTGKSHLAAGIVFDVLLSGESAMFVPWVEHLDAIRDSFGNRKTSTAELMAVFTDPYLLAIDDLDKEPPSDWTHKTLYKIINYRYNHNLPTVITLNHSLDSEFVSDIMPPAVLDRVLERTWREVPFTGPSYRSGLVL